ncbi:Sec-independent protein translocase protein TatB [Persephonella sp.]
MFGIGFSELILIFIVALLVLGPKRLPEVAKTLGRFYREIKSTVDEVKEVIVEEPTKPPTPPLEDKLSDIEEPEVESNKKDKGKELKEPKREKISFKKGEKVDGAEPEKS